MKSQQQINMKMRIWKWKSLLLVSILCLSSWQIKAYAKSLENNTATQESKIEQSSEKSSPADVLQQMTQAQVEGKYTYLLFYENGNKDCDLMRKRLDTVAKENPEKLEIFKIDRNDPKYKTIVMSMRVQTAPIPLTLLKAPNGKIVKSFTRPVSVEDLLNAFPSPAKMQSMSLLDEGKSIILCFSSQEMPFASNVQSTCSAAKEKLNGKAAYINVDMSDPNEKGFIKEMNINLAANDPVTIVVNSKRQITGRYTGDVKADELIAAATKVSAGGCGPAGSGKSCGPRK